MVHPTDRQLQAAPPGTSKRYYDASSPGSSLVAQSGTVSRDGVPSGIVASRILVLQKTGPGKSDVLLEPTQSTSILIEHDRDSTHTGFGRRVKNPFGHPAVQNPKPGEETSGVNSHTFVGLNTSRKNHNEHHALVQPHLRMVRSSTQMQLLAQPQDDIPNKKGLWKSKSQNTMRPVYRSLDSGVMEEMDPSGNKRDIVARTAIFPDGDDVDQSEVSRTQVKSRKTRTLISDTSFVTTSSVRRQSVRDLFADYGIDRPAGLISKHTFRDMGNTVRLEKLPRECHLCGWNNNSVYASCWRCGHNAYPRSDGKPELLSQPATKRNEDPHNKLIDVSKSVVLPMKIKFVEEEPIKFKALAVPQAASYSDRRVSSPTVSDSSSTFTELTTPQLPLQNEAPVQALREEWSRIQLLTGAKTTTKIKESPFVLADSQATKFPVRYATTGLSHYLLLLLAQNRRHAPHQLSKEYRNDCSSSENEERDELAQQIASSNKAHNANRYTGPLPTQKDRVHEETDKGYAADTSIFGGSTLGAVPGHEFQLKLRSQEDTDLSTNTTLIDESSPPHSRRFQRLLEYAAKSDSVPSPTSFKRSHSSQHWQHLSTFDKQVPELVECHGYPRTGHTRHDVSSVDAGTVGGCQHCLDDCSCAACQSTHHSVRCCTHPDHQAMVHIHHTPPQDTLRQDLTEFTTSLSKVTHLDSVPVSPRSSIAGPSIQQRTRDLLERSKQATNSKKPVEPIQPSRRVVKTGMNVGNSQSSIVPGTSPPLLTYLDVLSRLSRRYSSDSDSNTNSLSYFTPVNSVKDQTSIIKNAANIDSNGINSTTLPSQRISTQLGVAGMEREPKKGRLEGQATRKAIEDIYTMVESGIQENSQPMATSRTLLPALTAGRIGSKMAADKKAKLKLIERNMTPVDGNSEVAPGTMMYGRRGASSVHASGDGESRSCASLSHGNEHQCIWKRRYIESLANRNHTRQASGKDKADVNISGITVVLHLEGKEDLVIKAESW